MVEAYFALFSMGSRHSSMTNKSSCVIEPDSADSTEITKVSRKINYDLPIPEFLFS